MWNMPEGAAIHLGLAAHVQKAHQLARLQAVEADLAKYHKREDLELRQKTVYEIMAADQRTLHRQRRTTGFGALWCQVLSTSCHNPAGRWLWCEVLSFRWKQEAHINVLELCPHPPHFARPVAAQLQAGCGGRQPGVVLRGGQRAPMLQFSCSGP